MIHDILKIKQQVIHDVYVRSVTPSRPPHALYTFTADKLKKGLYSGYKGDMLKFKYNSPDLNLLAELRQNIYMFSGAKTFQQTLDMSSELIGDDGNFRSFDDFKEVAGGIFDKYNEDWLETEYNTAIGQARSASKWVDIEKNKETFPLLKYVAVGDEHTCEICLPLDGIVARADDDFWDENMPLNHFNCECTVEQLEEEEATPTDDGVVDDLVERSQTEKNPMFNMNPGKSGEVFKSTGEDKHAYFIVPKEYQELAKNNFNLPIPNKDEN